MNKYWFISSIIVGAFWGILIGLITSSIFSGLAMGAVGFFANIMVCGFCLMAKEGDKYDEKI